MLASEILVIAEHLDDAEDAAQRAVRTKEARDEATKR
jgi:hypothetical protein